jgi:hypothetical protein
MDRQDARPWAPVVVGIHAPMPRCVMVDLPQIGLPPAPGLLDAFGRLNAAALGVVADVIARRRLVLRNEGNLNSETGLPMSVLNLEPAP